MVKVNDESVYVSAIGRKFKPFENRSQRKCQGNLMLIKLHENPNLSSVMFTR